MASLPHATWRQVRSTQVRVFNARIMNVRDLATFSQAAIHTSRPLPTAGVVIYLVGSHMSETGLLLNGFWTDSGKSEAMRFSDIEFGSLAQGMAASFTSRGQGKPKKRRSRSQPTRQPIDFSSVKAQVLLPTPLALTNAEDASKSGDLRPCDREYEAIMDEIAKNFGGTFNDFVNSKGGADFDWNFHLPAGITQNQMRQGMRSLGFREFTNLDPVYHTPTFLGGYHWEGNVMGNWFHVEWNRNSNGYYIARGDGHHYEVDRPSKMTHGWSSGGKHECK